MRSGAELVAEAKPSRVELVPPAAPSFAEAADAAKRFPWYTGHPYPSCFVCGPERTPGDGLCIHPGAIPERNVAAAPFLLDPSIVDANGRLRPEIAWAALDCPSWFGFDCFHAFEGRILLGRLTARIDDLPRLGDRCIAGGWFLERDGRKIHCGSAIWSESGAVLAVARATWITLK